MRLQIKANNQNGFSLLELLITLSLIAIISLITIPSLKTFTQKSKQQILLSNLLHAISLTRSEAIANHERAMLCHSSDQQTCGGEWQDGFLITTTERVLHSFQVISADGSLHWRAFPLSREWLEFLPSGLTNAEHGTYWFCQNTVSYPVWAIVINRVGRVRVIVPDKDNKMIDAAGNNLEC
ncbi:MAG: GspH/FimT family pseudopilin [Gammaproteobacteria bacterium]